MHIQTDIYTQNTDSGTRTSQKLDFTIDRGVSNGVVVAGYGVFDDNVIGVA